MSVERHPRTTPTPKTIVNASTNSTAQAKKAPRTIRTSLVLTVSLPNRWMGARPGQDRAPAGSV
jgi:hypothetical protein